MDGARFSASSARRGPGSDTSSRNPRRPRRRGGPAPGRPVRGRRPRGPSPAEASLEPALTHRQRLDPRVGDRDRAPGPAPPSAGAPRRRRRSTRCAATTGVERPGARGRRHPTSSRRRGRPPPAGHGTRGDRGAGARRRASSRVPTGSSVVSPVVAPSPSRRPGDVDPQSPPPEASPPQRLHELEGLDAVDGDRRGPQVGEPLLHPHAGARVGQVEVAVDQQLLDPAEATPMAIGRMAGIPASASGPDAADPGRRSPRTRTPQRDGRSVQDRRHEQPPVRNRTTRTAVDAVVGGRRSGPGPGRGGRPSRRARHGGWGPGTSSERPASSRRCSRSLARARGRGRTG